MHLRLTIEALWVKYGIELTSLAYWTLLGDSEARFVGVAGRSSQAENVRKGVRKLQREVDLERAPRQLESRA